MLKKTITYKDYDGNERTEDHYFNLTEAELTEMDMSTPGGMENLMKNIAMRLDGKMIIETFKNLIQKSYGVKSPDGRRFDKSPEALRDFVETNAYSQLFMELVTNAEAAAEFFNGIIPQMKNAEPTGETPKLVTVE